MAQSADHVVDAAALRLYATEPEDRESLLLRIGEVYASAFVLSYPERSEAEMLAYLDAFTTAIVERVHEIELSAGGQIGNA